MHARARAVSPDRARASRLLAVTALLRGRVRPRPGKGYRYRGGPPSRAAVLGIPEGTHPPGGPHPAVWGRDLTVLSRRGQRAPAAADVLRRLGGRTRRHRGARLPHLLPYRRRGDRSHPGPGHPDAPPEGPVRGAWSTTLSASAGSTHSVTGCSWSGSARRCARISRYRHRRRIGPADRDLRSRARSVRGEARSPASP